MCFSFGIFDKPRIAFAALKSFNAGTWESFGNEDDRNIIEPVISYIFRESCDSSFIGPLPPDTAFTESTIKGRVICCSYVSRPKLLLPQVKYLGLDSRV